MTHSSASLATICPPQPSLHYSKQLLQGRCLRSRTSGARAKPNSRSDVGHPRQPLPPILPNFVSTNFYMPLLQLGAPTSFPYLSLFFFFPSCGMPILSGTACPAVVTAPAVLIPGASPYPIWMYLDRRGATTIGGRRRT